MITDKLKSYAAANKDLGLKFEHRQHKGLNNRCENSHEPTRVREKVIAPIQIGPSTAALFVDARPSSQCIAALPLQPGRQSQTCGSCPGLANLGIGQLRPVDEEGQQLIRCFTSICGLGRPISNKLTIPFGVIIDFGNVGMMLSSRQVALPNA